MELALTEGTNGGGVMSRPRGGAVGEEGEEVERGDVGSEDEMK